MKDPGRNILEIIRTDMKERQAARARNGVRRREIGWYLLTFLRVGIIKGLIPVICLLLCIFTSSLRAGMLSAMDSWSQTYESNLDVFSKSVYENIFFFARAWEDMLTLLGNIYDMKRMTTNTSRFGVFLWGHSQVYLSNNDKCCIYFWESFLFFHIQSQFHWIFCKIPLYIHQQNVII